MKPSKIGRMGILLPGLVMLAMALSPWRAGALPTVAGGGMIREEGEFLCDQMWTNDDKINVATSLITSGGTMTFDLLSVGLKYTLSEFFVAAIKPIEVWLSFIQHWRFETYLRAPEDFRAMTGALLDKRVDIGWLAIKCDNLSREEGWYNIYPSPFAFQTESLQATNIDGGTAEPEPNPGPSDPSPAAAGLPPTSSVTIISAEVFPIVARDSKNFEEVINNFAMKGGFANSPLRLPAGSRYISLKYDGIRGPDGFFLTSEGECHLLEMKWWEKGGATLGQIGVNRSTKVTQTTPEWLFHSIYRIKNNPAQEDRFAELLEKSAGTPFNKFLRFVKYVQENKNAIAIATELTDKEIEYCSDLEKIAGYVERNIGKEIGEGEVAGFMRGIGQFVEKLHVGIVLKKAGSVTYLGKVVESMKKWGRRFGSNPHALEEMAEDVEKVAMREL